MNVIWEPTSCLSRAELRQYLDGQLGGEGLFRVENHLLDCPLCRAAVEGYAAAEPAVTWVELDAHIPPPSAARAPLPGTATRWRRLVPWGLAAALVLGSGWAAISYWRQSLPDRLYVAYFSPQPFYGYAQLRAATGVQPPPALLDALQRYTAGAYAESYASFAQYLNSHPTDDRAHLYAALSAMQLGRLHEAEQWLTPLLASDNAGRAHEAQWYLALLTLQNRQYSRARQLLTTLAHTPHTEYQLPAQTLLAELPQP